MTTDDFEARWRAAANADPGHCTYPEAVPGYRASRATQRRTRPAEGPRKRQPDPDAHRAAEPITWTHHDTGGMSVHYPPVDAPITVDEIRHAMAAIDQAARDTSARLATDNADQAPADAIARAKAERTRWWDPRRWWPPTSPRKNR